MAVCRRLLTFPLAEKWMDAAVAGSEDGIRKRDQRTDHPRPLCAAPRGHLIVSLSPTAPTNLPNNAAPDISQPTNRYNTGLHSKASFRLQRFLVSCGNRKWCRQRWRQKKKYHPTLQKSTTPRCRRTSETRCRHQKASIVKGRKVGRQQGRKRGRVVQGHHSGGMLCLHGGGGVHPVSGYEAFQAPQRTRGGADSCANSAGGVYELGIERCWQGSHVGL